MQSFFQTAKKIQYGFYDTFCLSICGPKEGRLG